MALLCPIPLALYVHIPWCVRKCPYCDFNSHEARGLIPEAAYVGALLADLEQDLPRVWGRRIESVFIGGGTPSLFSAEALDRLLAGLRARLPLRPDTEITLEANPGRRALTGCPSACRVSMTNSYNGWGGFMTDAPRSPPPRPRRPPGWTISIWI